MSRLPGNREVGRALLGTVKEVKKALSDLNRQAASRLAAGDYETAESMVALGRIVNEFLTKVESLRNEWRTLAGGAGTRGSNTNTPLWAFYEPILRALVQLGGEAKRTELEGTLEDKLSPDLKPGDRIASARGVPRWKVMVRRARRPMVQEGFLEEDPRVWRLTDTGRKAAAGDQGLRRLHGSPSSDNDYPTRL